MRITLPSVDPRGACNRHMGDDVSVGATFPDPGSLVALSAGYQF